MAIKNIVFDLGGVIIELDTQRPIDRFKEVGVKDAAELLDPYEQKGLFLEFENGKVDMNTFQKELSKHAGKPLTLEEITYGWMGFLLHVSQEKLDYMEELRQQYNVYILSNTNPVIMGWARTPAFSPAGRPLTDYCDKIYASFEIGVTKPDVRIFNYMLADAQLIPEETLFVDDGKRNVEVGVSLGFHVYQPANGEDWREKVASLLG
ncbi:HAD family phosphatase [Parabacteroides sp. 52]|uniref:HAD family hydrolase n=1 Tax=unclassified Parabacteroides TaxID=2649774 RepID=UPI0013D014E0|nr:MULTISPECIES: HAD family phosphatase [unclassified Parabacteroides]MDH6533918.1 HAD superfamily hydrolase (TIGR01509 family) [Parabacteroides sp. PM5-20]NDV54663.1 HAD family phosphatase [Parabacteroides sp. 52]